jgi:ankyrin repeat protein
MFRFTALVFLFSVSPTYFASAGPLHDAVRAGDLTSAEALLSTSDLEETDFVLGTPLHVAVSTGSAELARLLISSGADIEAASELLAMRPLHLAASSTDIVTVGLLIAAGADLNSLTGEGETALHIAVRLGQREVVDLLLESGADFDVQEPSEGMTPLHIAAFQGNLPLVETLVSVGADPTARDYNARAPLFLASSSASFANVGDGSLIEYLVVHGADLEAQDTSGLTALSYAEARGTQEYRQIADVLRSLGAKN